MTQDYKTTLNLPKTDFPMKAQLAEREPKMLQRWDEMQIYRKMIDTNEASKPYVLHDGPPYANGRLHLGTILNKILKDIVVKYKNMSGLRCEFVPGWDCHGLPIELAVERSLEARQKHLEPNIIRKACRKHADKFVGIQRDEFKRLGCFGRWEKPYKTMSYDYEATIAREFGKFVAGDLVYKAKKPIYWCASCQTALAEAEVEYADHSSPSIFVKFKLEDDEEYRKKWDLKEEPIYLVIWTTTPWTIPANLAIALHPDLPYVAAKVDNEIWVVAEGLLDSVMSAVDKSYSTIVAHPSSRDLEKKHCRHPLLERSSIIILGKHVTLEAGTGAVHTAPGHGQEDYDVGMQYGLEPLAPIDDAGKFTKESGLPWLTGIYVEDANEPIIKHLDENGALVVSKKITHSYPHCWRCKKPIVFRSTEQWFVSMDRKDLRKRALSEINQVQWIPYWGKNRIGGMVEARPDWCISRQRFWGVPIIAVGCKSCGEIHSTPELVEKAAVKFENSGADAWFDEPVENFLPDGFSCPACKESDPKSFVKEKDILDVWFDSGVSFAAVLENEENIKDKADLYLEGSDQHRGWFHTALLTSVATRSRAPYKRVLTHGFVVDGEGKKYSKSAGNYVPPEELIKKHGAEILRLWVAAEDYRDDIRFSEEILKRLIESYRKARNTIRYLLGNLNDFDPRKDLVEHKDLCEIDKWALSELESLTKRILSSYENFEFYQIYHALNRYFTVDLSSFYLDILKDRLYAEKKEGMLRRSAQTVLWYIADSIVRLMAPLLSFTAEEVWEYIPKATDKSESVFMERLPQVNRAWYDAKLSERWTQLMTIRTTVTKVLEQARVAKLIGNSLAAKITIEATDEIKNFLKSFGDNLADLFIVSQVEFGAAFGEYIAESEDIPGLKVSVHNADGQRCARCWKYSTSVGESKKHSDICKRCDAVVSS